MQLNRAQLVTAIDQAIADGAQRHAEESIAWEAYENSERSRWIAANGQNWQMATQLIRKKLRQGEPIVKADLPEGAGWHRDVALYSGPANTPGKPRRVVGEYQASAELLRLKTALSLVVDELVTVTALNKIGITAQTIRFVLDRIAGNGSGE